MRTTAQLIEAIRAALAELEGRPDEEQVLTMLWRHLANRKPQLMGFGQPTEPIPIKPPDQT
jgi:hypothetical protein